MHSTPLPPSTPKTSLWSNRNFVLLWIGQAISLLGDAIFDLTLIVWIAAVLAKQQPWAPLAVSGVLVAATLPVILIGPLAGVFVDRWDKRQTMLWMDLLRALLVASLLLVTGAVRFPFFAGGRPSLPVQLGAIYSVVFFASICAQFFQPARLALMGDVVEEAQRAQASGLGQVTQSLASILGPPLAAPLLFGFGVQWALLINALSFGLSFLVLAAVQAPPSARSVEPGHGGTLGQEFRQGLRFAFSHRVIRALIIASFITLLGAGAINALNVFFFTQNLHASVTLVGLMDAVFGIGIIVGALLAGAFALRIGLERTLSWTVLAAGIVFLILARMTNLGAALGLIALLGVFQAGISVSIGPLVLKVTPRFLVGRVAAVLTPSSTLASLVAVVLAGYLASTVLDRLHVTVLGMTVGPIDTIFTGAGLLIVLAGLYLLRNLGQAT
ncbi:MAG TPA: MFS transporter, partial [Ktedonobacteraceae bacterium]